MTTWGFGLKGQHLCFGWKCRIQDKNCDFVDNSGMACRCFHQARSNAVDVLDKIAPAVLVRYNFRMNSRSESSISSCPGKKMRITPSSCLKDLVLLLRGEDGLIFLVVLLDANISHNRPVEQSRLQLGTTHIRFVSISDSRKSFPFFPCPFSSKKSDANRIKRK
jgi:hypothetical protein